jgi:hypothetical protein
MLENNTSKLRRLSKSVNDDYPIVNVASAFARAVLGVTDGPCTALRRKRKAGEIWPDLLHYSEFSI